MLYIFLWFIHVKVSKVQLPKLTMKYCVAHDDMLHATEREKRRIL